MGALCECQELIQLSLEKPFGYMVCPEGIPKFLLGDNMAIRLHGAIVIPPNTGSTMKLLGNEVSFARVRTWYNEKGELRFHGMKLGVGIQRFFSLTEKRGLSTKEILIARHLRIEVITTSS
jgi:hypothetical protein